MRRFHSKRAKRPVRWFANPQTFMDKDDVIGPVTGSINPFFRILAMHTRETSTAGPDLVERMQRQTIMAIRGTLIVAPSAVDTECIARLGIRVAQLDENGVPNLLSPALPQDANVDWMWLEHLFVPSKVGQATNYYSAMHIPIHIKTRRVLKDQEALILQADMAVAFPDEDFNGSYFLYSYLRTLVADAA